MSTEISTNTAPRGLALQSFDDAFRFSKMVAGSEFAPKDFRGKPESCLLAIQHGSEIGLAPMQSLQCIAVINGRPSIWGDAAKALCISSPTCEWITEEIEGEGENMVAVCTAKRKGNPKPTVSRFSVADAKTAKLWGKRGNNGQDTPWITAPKRMLQLRARGFALRDAFPDVLKGLITAEEAQDYPTQASAQEPVREPAREPVVVRPKLDPPTTRATEEDMQRSRLAVNRTNDVAALKAMRGKVDERLKSGHYTPAQADELLDLITGRIEFLESEPEDSGTDFPAESAEHEVQA